VRLLAKDLWHQQPPFAMESKPIEALSD
jgi:hypothetical protein